MWVQVVYLKGDTGKHCQGSGEVRQLREGKQKKVRYWQVIAVGKWGLIPPEIPRIYHKMYLKLNPIEWWKSWRVYPSTHWLYAVGGGQLIPWYFRCSKHWLVHSGSQKSPQAKSCRCWQWKALWLACTGMVNAQRIRADHQQCVLQVSSIKKIQLQMNILVHILPSTH